VLAVGEKLGSSGQDAVLAFIVGWEVICQTNKPCHTPEGHTLLSRGWHNQGFQPALGCAAAAAKLMGFDIDQTRMALGNAASTMSGLHKNCGSDTKPFHGGNPPMHGVMASELVASGFTANKDIFDGSWGAARMMGLEGGDAEKILDGLGTWDLATNGGILKLHACNGGGFWAQAALQNFLRTHPTPHDDIESIEVHISAFLMDELPHHLPQTGLEAKFSIEYDLATIALDGKAGMRQYTDPMVLRPEAQAFMKRVTYVPLGGDLWKGSRIVITLKNGEQFEETATQYHGQPQDPLSESEITDKFHDCAQAVLTDAQRKRAADLCWHLDDVGNLAEVADAVRPSPT
jgi:2-methylcitrate dehydratase PrpD